MTLAQKAVYGTNNLSEFDIHKQVVEKFADDHDDWQKTFFNAWEKMQQNGYDNLVSAPSNGNLLGVKGPEGVPIPCVDKASSDFCNFRNQQRCKNKWWYPKSQCMATCGYCETDSNGNLMFNTFSRVLPWICPLLFSV